MLTSLAVLLLVADPVPNVPLNPQAQTGPAGQVTHAGDTTAAAQPLRIRVLEKERAVEAEIAGDSISCDNKKLPNKTILVRANDRRLKAGDQACEQLNVLGAEIKVTLKEDLNGPRDQVLTRTYPTRLLVANEQELLKLVNFVEVEDYLSSVVESEASPAAPAMLEAQSVVSRTFALASRGRHGSSGYDLCDLAHCQVYRGKAKDPASKAAVAKTKGQVLLVGGVVLKPAFFHSSCGGATSRALDVFGDEGAGAAINDTGKEGPLCKGAPDFAWSWEIDRSELARGLNARPDGAAVEVLRRDSSGRIVQLKSFGVRYSGNELLAKLGATFGYDTVRSMKMTVEESEGVVHFKGTGLGHGSGLCQEGAKAIATKGGTAQQILQRYFPDCQVRAW
ncbi:MAG: SpoIID/LytB domain-containing protein [Myxococcaceae bacterium]